MLQSVQPKCNLFINDMLVLDASSYSLAMSSTIETWKEEEPRMAPTLTFGALTMASYFHYSFQSYPWFPR